MQNSVLYLARSALVPILCSDIAAGSSCNVHSGLITVFTVGTLPNKLSAVLDDGYLAVIAT